MPFALVIVGLILVITGVKGTQAALAAELKEDLTGDNNFTWWILAIGTIGALGYISAFRSFSRWFMALIIISMLLANRGFFSQLEEAFRSGPIAPEVEKAADPLTSDDTWKKSDPVDTMADVVKRQPMDAFWSPALFLGWLDTLRNRVTEQSRVTNNEVAAIADAADKERRQRMLSNATTLGAIINTIRRFGAF